MKFLSKSLEDTDRVAKDFLNSLKIDKNKATLVGLSGDLGSGKTTFTQALGRELGINEFITSPTFVIEKIYKLNDNNFGFKNLIHIDAYRLESDKELATLGFEKILQEKSNLILIEWPEKVSEVLPKDLIKINFKFINENEREIEMI